MKFIRFFTILPALSLICIMSATILSCSDPAKEVSYIKSFKVKVGDEWISGDINSTANLISLPGIYVGSMIDDVDYSLHEDATIFPLPESRVGNWNQEERFVLYCSGKSVAFTVILTDYDENYEMAADAVIYPDRYYGREIKHMFYDLKLNASAIGSESKANDIFITDDMDGVRVSIYGDETRPAHPEEGKIDESYYSNLIKSINRAKTARASVGEELIVFASKKLDGKKSFPDWVKDGNGIIPEKYAVMLVDYILYMKGKGIVIDVLGIDNEINFNEGNITPQRHKDVVSLLKAAAVEKDFKMPLIIGPERYEPMGDVNDCWIRKFMNNGWGEYLDIYGTHYYPEHRYYNKLKYELSLIGDMPFWATEPHWGSEDKYPDHLDHAETAICALWDQTDLGMDAFMWWSYARSGSLRGCLMRAVSVPLRGARPVEVEDHDGEGIRTKGKLQTRAFREGNVINLYVINMCPESSRGDAKEYKDYSFSINAGKIDGNVTYTQWTDATPVEGAAYTAKKVNDKKFSLTLPVRSITHIVFDIN